LAIVSFDGLPPSWSCMPIICDFMASSHTRMCMQIRLSCPHWSKEILSFFPCFFLCEVYAEQAEPSFVFVSWSSYAV
jgi:hypothetical protein